MYSNQGTKFRADLTSAVMQASEWETGLIAGKVAPVVNVDTKDGQYPVFQLTKAGLLKRQTPLNRAPGATYARGNIAYEQDTYATKEYGFEMPLDYTERKDTARFFDAETIVSDQAKRKILLEWEIRAAALTFSTDNYGAATNSGTAYTLANIATFDVGLDVDLAKNRLRQKGESANDLTVVCSDDVFTRLRASTKLQNRLRGIGVSSDTILNVDEQAVAEALGVRQILVGRNYYDSADEDITFSASAIWSNTYMWVGQVKEGGSPEAMLKGGSQYTLNWAEYGSELSVFEYEQPEINSTVYRVSQHVAEKVINSNAGTLIATQYS